MMKRNAGEPILPGNQSQLGGHVFVPSVQAAAVLPSFGTNPWRQIEKGNREITLSFEELVDLTGYRQATKQLTVLLQRGFHRAFISATGGVILERSHFKSVSMGRPLEASKVANINFGKY
jgi:hypothetical protein